MRTRQPKHRKIEPDCSFRYAERCMYEHKMNCARLEILRDKLKELDASMSVNAQNYETLENSGIGDPVAVRALKIYSLEDEIFLLEQRVKPITRLIDDLSGNEILAGSLNAELMQVLRLFYIAQNPVELVIKELGISRRNFYRVRERLIKLAIKYLGL